MQQNKQAVWRLQVYQRRDRGVGGRWQGKSKESLTLVEMGRRPFLGEEGGGGGKERLLLFFHPPRPETSPKPGTGDLAEINSAGESFERAN